SHANCEKMTDSILTTRPRQATWMAGLPPQYVIGAFVLIAAVALSVVMSRTEAILAPLWLLGMAAGFTVQRSRFCFASAFRDLFLFGSARTMKGILIGLGIATIGFAMIMYAEVPFPGLGALPDEAHILPVGLSTVVGGLMFGVGMVLSGGCASGSLYRMAEGYVASWVSVGGLLIGLALLAKTWNWWWRLVISHEPRIWLPAQFNMGFGGAVALTFLGLFLVFLLVVWWESRAGLSMPDMGSRTDPAEGFAETLRGFWKKMFVSGWSAPVGGAILGGIVVLMYLTHMPWGVTGELTRYSNATLSGLNIAPPILLGLSEIGGCAGRANETGIFTHTFAVTIGLLPGALVGALFSREFKLRFPRSRVRYAQSLGGGVLMGYGSGLAIGCTIGAFFSSIPSLSVSGWLFGLALAAGAFLGVQVIKRIP
ncbi:MAG: YeeE/YedE family protein, partial [Chloroflexi bacterium]|nr:YeeE/YedE family protein [Chloroflexota bacterium]